MGSGVGHSHSTVLCVNISLHGIFHYTHLHAELNRCLYIISSIDTVLKGCHSLLHVKWREMHLVFFCLIAANNCSDPGPPTNGQRSLSGTTYNSIVTYTCDVGYILQGSNSRTCQPNGQWNGSMPECNGTSYKELAVILAAWYALKSADQTCFT